MKNGSVLATPTVMARMTKHPSATNQEVKESTRTGDKRPIFDALWFRRAINRDVSTGALARLFARSLALNCSLYSRAPLCSALLTLLGPSAALRTARFAHALRTANFARALRCAHSFARSLAHSIPRESGCLESGISGCLNHSEP